MPALVRQKLLEWSITMANPARAAGGSPASAETSRLIPVFRFGVALSAFFVVSFSLCVLSYLLLPELAIDHSALSLLLPGFKLLSWPSFFLGLVESFAYGWYIALVFGPIYNICVSWGR
jgi:hypothetical protein